MGAVGIRELKTRTSQVIRRVREGRETIDITYHGEIVARVVPASRSSSRTRTPAAWSTIDRVAKEIGARWPTGRSAAAAVREGRRGL
jgi:prevent-host-death family protein